MTVICIIAGVSWFIGAVADCLLVDADCSLTGGQRLRREVEDVVKRALESIAALLVIGVLLFTVMAGMAWYADRMYGDWTCAFVRCVKVKP